MKVLRVSHSAVVDAWRDRERELRARGVDVRTVTARSWDEGGTLVELAPRPGEPVLGVRTVGRHPALFLYDPIPLWRVLKEDWDLVDIHEEPFALATAEILALRRLRALLGRRTAPPFVLYSAQNLAKRYPWPFRRFEARALRTAAGVSVCNEAAGRICRAKGAVGRIEMIPLGVDPGLFSPARARAGDRHHDRPWRVGYAGRLADHKGVDVLLRALSGMRGVQLDLAGDGPARHRLEDEARTNGIAVRFRGSLDGSDLVSFYRSLDVLAVPSRETPGWVEQFGRVAVEAMACGVPVVATDTGALPDVVGGAGLLVPADDPAALRDSLLRLRADDELAARLRTAGTARADSCSWHEVAGRYQALYRTVLAPGPADVVTVAPAPPEVIVVAYGAPQLLRRALDPLIGKFALTVVDNSSSPRIREITEEAGGRYLDPGRNGGFAAGVNHGLAHRQEPSADVLLLNPDAVIGPEDVVTLQTALHARDRTASVGPTQVGPDGAPARVVWPYPSPAATWVEALGLGPLRPTPVERSFVVGSVLLLNAEALAELGGLDERFFLYAEETDWAYRANLAGWRNVLVPEATAVHVGGATSTDPDRRDTHFHASQEHFLRKHHGPLGWQVARTGAVLGAAPRALVLRGERRAAARRRLRSFLRGPARAEALLRTSSVPPVGAS